MSNNSNERLLEPLSRRDRLIAISAIFGAAIVSIGIAEVSGAREAAEHLLDSIFGETGQP